MTNEKIGPEACPLCGETEGWITVETRKTGHSVGYGAFSSIVFYWLSFFFVGFWGALVFGALGWWAGYTTLTRTCVTKYCKKCKFQHEYTGKALGFIK